MGMQQPEAANDVISSVIDMGTKAFNVVKFHGPNAYNSSSMYICYGVTATVLKTIGVVVSVFHLK